MKRNWTVALFAASFLLVLAASSDTRPASASPAAAGLEQTVNGTSSSAEAIRRPNGWTEESHGNDVAPNYSIVFPQDRVNEITITVAPGDWQAMLDDTDRFLAPRPSAEGVESPGRLWVPATVEFGGKQWTNVGVRHKGGGSRWKAWVDDSLKMPLKLDFDQFEDEHPEIKNQRFHGFKQLSFANDIWDDSHLRDALAYDLLEEVGLAAAQTAHYFVTFNVGQQRFDLGVYTGIEVIDDTVVQRHFGDDSGNIYEGEGPAASLAAGTLEALSGSLLKKNNEKEADWSDIRDLYTILHSGQRISAPQAWRASLESVFNVNAFLKWLALSALLDHSDTYGQHPHNFYLYDDPSTGLLTWISWDHDRMLGGNRIAVLDRGDVGAEWPLIRHILDQPPYYATYMRYLSEMARGAFNPDRMEAKSWKMARIVGQYAARESSGQEYHAAVSSLIQAIRVRSEAVNAYLAAQSAGRSTPR